MKPVGFPGCRHCPFRTRPRPDVCLACFEASARQGCRGPRCPACGHPRPLGAACPMGWCARADRGWSVVFDVGAYEAGLRRAVLAYKYGGERWWAGVFGRLLAGYLDRNAGWFEDFDVVTAVPAYRGPGARRSWDPVAAALRQAGDLLGAGWDVEPGAVVKRVETPAFSGQGRRARARSRWALRAALRVPDPGVVAGRRVLVVDDVLAEGSTLREVAGVLRWAGAREVAGLVVARSRWVASPVHAGVAR